MLGGTAIVGIGVAPVPTVAVTVPVETAVPVATAVPVLVPTAVPDATADAVPVAPGVVVWEGVCARAPAASTSVAAEAPSAAAVQFRFIPVILLLSIMASYLRNGVHVP